MNNLVPVIFAATGQRSRGTSRSRRDTPASAWRKGRLCAGRPTGTPCDEEARCGLIRRPTTDDNALEFVRQGPNELTRASILYGLLAHNAEMYGVGTVYLRLKDIVPPSTERQSKRRGDAPR